MLGLLISEKELKEIRYLLKREMDEMLYDLHDHRMNKRLRSSVEKRYDTLFQLLLRVGPPSECQKYILTKKEKNKAQNKLT
ncbi:MAG: hypothetical protein ACRC5C_04290 [Bacilli bacterium]